MFNSVRKNALSITGIAALLFVFSACNKLDNNGNNNTPVAGLMAFNLHQTNLL